MTTIIARKNADGTVDLGADSQATAGNATRHANKLTHVNEQMYVGVAGRARYGDIIAYTEVPRIHPADLTAGDFDARGWLITEVVPAWIQGVKNAESTHLDKDDWPGGGVLVVLARQIFEIYGDFTVCEIPEFGGIGSGSDYALGALASGKSVQRALEIAAELDPYTGGELIVHKGLK